MEQASRRGRQRYYRKLALVSVLMVLMAFIGIVMPGQMHLLLALIGLVLFYRGLAWLRFYQGLSHWTQVEAVVNAISEQTIEEVESQYGTTTYCYPLIEYEYEYNEVSYQSSRVAFELENIWVPKTGNWGDAVSAREKFWSAWRQGSRIPVFVNPDKPGVSVIINRVGNKRKSHHRAMLAGGLILITIWILLFAWLQESMSSFISH